MILTYGIVMKVKMVRSLPRLIARAIGENRHMLAILLPWIPYIRRNGRMLIYYNLS